MFFYFLREKQIIYSIFCDRFRVFVIMSHEIVIKLKEIFMFFSLFKRKTDYLRKMG